jgi:enoyl-CoA hydratase/carnithine racemase
MSIEFERQDRIARITLNRPEKMNAMTTEMYAEITQRLNEIDQDPEIWAGIITGTGDRAFSAGADLAMEGRAGGAGWSAHRADRFDHGSEIQKPLIAAINGYCLAGGLELALICDIRVASPNAQFGCPEVKWNLLHGYGAQRLPYIIGLSNAMRLLLTGEFINAEEAYRVGLIQEIVPQEHVRDRAGEIATRICENGPMAVRMTKEMTLQALDMSLVDGLRLYAEYSRQVFRSEDMLEGTRSFAEKRKPVFQNR